MTHPTHIKLQCTNHPQKGSTITVDPIRKLEDIEDIKQLLKDKPRDYLLFIMGVNNGLRAGDLLKLKVSQFIDVKVDDKVAIREEKTGKSQEVVINQPILDALNGYLAHNGYKHNEYLFQSTRGFIPLTVSSVNHMVKAWCKKIGLQGNYGSHTLRKTFGYILRRHYGVSWEVICRRYNHSSPAITRAYLGIQDDEVNEVIVRCPI